MGSKARSFLGVFLLLVSTSSFGADEWQGVQFLGMESKVPAEWISEPVTSSMRVLQFAVSGSEGSEAVQFVVYYFGPKQGGSVEANLARWTSQFSNPDGGEVEDDRAAELCLAQPLLRITAVPAGLQIDRR